MTDIEALLNRWRSVGLLDGDVAERIRAWEAGQGQLPGLRWQGTVALVLGAILLAAGAVLFVSAHWDQLGPDARFLLVLAMLSVFHLAGAIVRDKHHGLSTALHSVGTVVAGVAIALVGQIFNIQVHWPAAVLLWAMAALAGWALLHDEVQQALALLLFPTWILCEIEFYTDQHIGQLVYLGRFLVVWAVLYLTAFLRSRREAVQGVLFATASIVIAPGILAMSLGWRSSSALETPISFATEFWAWVAIAGLPLAVAVFKGHWGLIPLASAIVMVTALPWCQSATVYRSPFFPNTAPYTVYVPSLLAHAVVAAFAVFIIGWGIRQSSRFLVNLGIAYFALSVAWFYFSNIFDKVSRSLGLIGMGILFLAGGWFLEKMRRSLLSRIRKSAAVSLEAR